MRKVIRLYFLGSGQQIRKHQRHIQAVKPQAIPSVTLELNHNVHRDIDRLRKNDIIYIEAQVCLLWYTYLPLDHYFFCIAKIRPLFDLKYILGIASLIVAVFIVS